MRSDMQSLKLNCLRNRTKPLCLLTAEFNLTRLVKVSPGTVRRSLKKFELVGRVATAKPLLHQANVKQHLAWAREHKNLFFICLVYRLNPMENFWKQEARLC